jgi:ADP-ribose pyrophosphatase YjhB (NUDIX family)
MKFCSNCGSGDLSWSVPPGDTHHRHHCLVCDTIFYANPKVVTGCIPIFEDKILLCRRGIEPRLGFWTIPGGYMENGESVEAAAAREAFEETGAQVQILNLHAMLSVPKISQVHVFFLADLLTFEFDGGEESLEVRMFTEAEIPWDELAFQTTHFFLRHFFEDRKNGVQGLHVGTIG